MHPETLLQIQNNGKTDHLQVGIAEFKEECVLVTKHEAGSSKKCSSNYFTYFQDSLEGQDGELPGQPEAAGNSTELQTLQLHIPPPQNQSRDHHHARILFSW